MAKKKKPATPKPTEIVLVVDRSGSMEAMREDAEGGVNAFVTDQAKEKGDCAVSLIQFDTEIEIVYQGEKPDKAPRYSLTPRGSTALRDAIGRGIALLEERLTKAKRKALAVLAIMTDGMENSSTDISPGKLRELLENCKAKGWGILYLAANQDAIAVGGEMGVAKGMAVNFTEQTVRGAYLASSQNVRSFRRSGDSAVLCYSDEQRAALDPGAAADSGTQWMTSTQAASHLGMSPRTLKRREANGSGPVVHRATSASPRRYKREDLDEYLRKTSS